MATDLLNLGQSPTLCPHYHILDLVEEILKHIFKMVPAPNLYSTGLLHLQLVHVTVLI